jgi:hypothetical protein
MKRKMLGVFVSLLAVAMFALPMSTAFAEKPIEMTLTGTFIMADPNPDHFVMSNPGHNIMFKARDFVSVWTGEIDGSGVYQATWLINPKAGKWVDDVKAGKIITPGCFILEGVTINDVQTGFTGTGDIRFQPGMVVAGGSGDLRSITGKGITYPNPPDQMVFWDYIIDVQITP